MILLLLALIGDRGGQRAHNEGYAHPRPGMILAVLLAEEVQEVPGVLQGCYKSVERGNGCVVL
jgi:hypothetical protein